MKFKVLYVLASLKSKIMCLSVNFPMSHASIIILHQVLIHFFLKKCRSVIIYSDLSIELKFANILLGYHSKKKKEQTTTKTAINSINNSYIRLPKLTDCRRLKSIKTMWNPVYLFNQSCGHSCHWHVQFPVCVTSFPGCSCLHFLMKNWTQEQPEEEQARRQGGFEGFARTPLLAPKRFYIHCYSTF